MPNERSYTDESNAVLESLPVLIGNLPPGLVATVDRWRAAIHNGARAADIDPDSRAWIETATLGATVVRNLVEARGFPEREVAAAVSVFLLSLITPPPAGG